MSNFEDVKKVAIESGALGCSLSGSGPSIFALCETNKANDIRKKNIPAIILSGGPSSVYDNDAPQVDFDILRDNNFLILVKLHFSLIFKHDGMDAENSTNL